MRTALHAEWTKLHTTAGTVWLLLAVIPLTVTLSVAVALAVRCTDGNCPADTTRLSLVGVDLGQALVAVVAVLLISTEHSTGMIRTTLTAMPRRLNVLSAKAILLVGTVTATGTVAVLASLLAGRLILPGRGFTPAHGHLPLSLADGPTLRAAGGSVLYLVLIALLSLGVATAVRDSGSAIGTVLGLLYLFPILAQVANDPYWQRFLQQVAPMNAGLSIQATKHLGGLPVGPWAGLAVLATWATCALVTGGLALRLRDA